MNKIIITNVSADGNGYVTAHGNVVLEFSIGQNGHGTIPKIDDGTLRGVCVGIMAGLQGTIADMVIEHDDVVIPTSNSEFNIDSDGKLCSYIKD